MTLRHRGRAANGDEGSPVPTRRGGRAGAASTPRGKSGPPNELRTGKGVSPLKKSLATASPQDPGESSTPLIKVEETRAADAETALREAVRSLEDVSLNKSGESPSNRGAAKLDEMALTATPGAMPSRIPSMSGPSSSTEDPGSPRLPESSVSPQTIGLAPSSNPLIPPPDMRSAIDNNPQPTKIFLRIPRPTPVPSQATHPETAYPSLHVQTPEDDSKHSLPPSTQPLSPGADPGYREGSATTTSIEEGSRDSIDTEYVSAESGTADAARVGREASTGTSSSEGPVMPGGFGR